MKLFNWILIVSVFSFFGCEKSEVPIQKEVHFLVAGQSNAMGVGDKEESIQQDNSNVVEYNSEYNDITVLNDPVGQYHLGFQKAKTGSFIPALGHTYNKLTNSEVFVVQAAKGGSALTPEAETNDWGNWSSTGDLFQNSITKVEKMQTCLIAKEKNKPVLNAIFWSQGENDGEAIANGIITKQKYKNALIDLIDRYYTEFGEEIPFIIVETGEPIGSISKVNGFKEVRESQREVAEIKSNVYIGYNETELFKERGWLKDVVHYNQKALNHIGEKLAYFYASLEE